MTLTLVLVLFLIAAIIFGIDFLIGFVGANDVRFGHWRVYSLAWGLMAVALLLWHGGQ